MNRHAIFSPFSIFAAAKSLSMPTLTMPTFGLDFDSGAMVAAPSRAIHRGNRSGVAAVKRAAKKRKAVIRARRLRHA